MKPLGTNLERDIERSMFDYMPKEYEEYRESVAIIETEAVELELLNARINDALNQFNAQSATWGLKAYEYDLGITSKQTKPLEERRSVVISKLRGAGTTTKELIKNVAQSYAASEVEVSEDNPNYTVVIRFVGTLGIPPNMSDFEKTLREVIPAHLTYRLEYTYVTYNVMKVNGMTYDQLKATGLTYEDLKTTEF
ncbi:putative phage tail protein [Paenisporosarcina sp. NPDC076898]|uniref:putative phage tail protein n=1 Tax=unclassified Paenisporosarcina TaxID=2642018 RepID=UPI003D04E7AB